LIIETTGQAGEIAIADGGRICCHRHLLETRRHARDLAPGVAQMLQELQWRPGDIEAVAVSIGPGSYTGLRIGIISAKIFSFATGARLIAIPTFEIIADRSDVGQDTVEVIADGQQSMVYQQRLRLDDAGKMRAVSPLTIRDVQKWIHERDPADWLTGPGIENVAERLPPAVKLIPPARRQADAEGLLRLAMMRFAESRFDEVAGVAPLYLRPSSAEQKWSALGRS
jgi:tRNA threonylcarbamoyladenosine biosynthesis protein TsaB